MRNRQIYNIDNKYRINITIARVSPVRSQVTLPEAKWVIIPQPSQSIGIFFYISVAILTK